MVEDGKIQPVIYAKNYLGLDAVPEALKDAQKHKTWGRAVLRINEGAETYLLQKKSRL
jgi:D-arabinose 1-dehydrogenase-like Zn-dependent alcohol dehydrogenase